MNTARKRVRVTLAATILATVLGLCAGLLLGCGLALRQAMLRLQQDTGRLIAEENATLKETYTTMTQMSSSPYPHCSEAEMAYFRKLLFQTDFLRDGGRMRDGKIDCSTTLDKVDLPTALMKPAYSMPGGTNVYQITGPLQIRDQPTLGLQFNDLYVVINSGAGRRVDSSTLPFMMTLRPASSGKPGRLLSMEPQPEDAVFTTEGLARKGQTLYFTRCTADNLSCTTTYLRIPEALQGERSVLRYCMLLGGLAGALFGFLVSLVYRRSRNMAQQLRRAISKDKLRMVYQPIVDLASKRIVGAEALARWTDEEGFAVGPDTFVRVAEESGFVGALTRLVVRHALRDFGVTLRDHPNFRLSVNVAAADLSDPSFLPMLEEALILSGVAAPSLAIEITERSTARHEVAIETIRRLQEMGHSVHIDDFGTGYSSLSYLQDLAISAIKIDKSFTRSVGTQAVTVAILPQILAMAEALKLQVIVEGIETAPQADYFSFLAQPVLAQGWFFGYPVPAERFQHLLAEDEQKTQAETATL
jgi:sensor c-di-GMP phosphodiesterase-like protein